VVGMDGEGRADSEPAVMKLSLKEERAILTCIITRNLIRI